MNKIEELSNQLTHTDWRKRLTAAQSLGATGESAAVYPLLTGLEDEKWEVRRAVVESLGNLRDKKAVKKLIKALGDENWRVRQGAGYALGYIGDETAVDPLVDRLFDDDEWRVRQASTFALKFFQVPKSVKALVEALEDENWHVRCQAAESLGVLEATEAVGPISKAAQKANPRAKFTMSQVIKKLKQLVESTKTEKTSGENKISRE